jgi:hypothetical protein
LTEDGITTNIRGAAAAVEVVAKLVCFTRGEDFIFGRLGSDVMHRDADGCSIIGIEDEGST